MEPTLKFSVMGYSNDQCYMRPPMFVLFCRTNYRLLVVEHEKKLFIICYMQGFLTTFIDNLF